MHPIPSNTSLNGENICQRLTFGEERCNMSIPRASLGPFPDEWILYGLDKILYLCGIKNFGKLADQLPVGSDLWNSSSSSDSESRNLECLCSDTSVRRRNSQSNVFVDEGRESSDRKGMGAIVLDDTLVPAQGKSLQKSVDNLRKSVSLVHQALEGDNKNQLSKKTLRSLKRSLTEIESIGSASSPAVSLVEKDENISDRFSKSAPRLASLKSKHEDKDGNMEEISRTFSDVRSSDSLVAVPRGSKLRKSAGNFDFEKSLRRESELVRDSSIQPGEGKTQSRVTRFDSFSKSSVAIRDDDGYQPIDNVENSGDMKKSSNIEKSRSFFSIRSRQRTNSDFRSGDGRRSGDAITPSTIPKVNTLSHQSYANESKASEKSVETVVFPAEEQEKHSRKTTVMSIISAPSNPPVNKYTLSNMKPGSLKNSIAYSGFAPSGKTDSKKEYMRSVVSCPKKLPKIIGTTWAMARINIFNDCSRTYEILEIKGKLPQAVIPCKTVVFFAVLPDGTTICYDCVKPGKRCHFQEDQK